MNDERRTSTCSGASALRLAQRRAVGRERASALDNEYCTRARLLLVYVAQKRTNTKKAPNGRWPTASPSMADGHSMASEMACRGHGRAQLRHAVGIDRRRTRAGGPTTSHRRCRREVQNKPADGLSLSPLAVGTPTQILITWCTDTHVERAPNRSFHSWVARFRRR